MNHIDKILSKGDLAGVQVSNYKDVLVELAIDLKKDFYSDERFDNFMKFIKLIPQTREDINIVNACFAVLFRNINLMRYASADQAYREWADSANDFWYKNTNGVFFDEESYLEYRNFFEERLKKTKIAA